MNAGNCCRLIIINSCLINIIIRSDNQPVVQILFLATKGGKQATIPQFFVKHMVKKCAFSHVLHQTFHLGSVSLHLLSFSILSAVLQVSFPLLFLFSGEGKPPLEIFQHQGCICFMTTYDMLLIIN